MITDAVRRRNLEPGQLLFAAGDPIVSLFVVSSGRVRLLRRGPEGSALCLHTAGKGEALAEASLFSDVYHCDAVAQEPCEVKVLSKREVLASLQADPRASLGAMAHLARQVQSLRARVEIMTVRSARARLLAYLDWLREPGQNAISIDRSWKELATEIGLTHEVVYRTLAALENEKLIVREGRDVEFRT